MTGDRMLSQISVIPFTDEHIHDAQIVIESLDSYAELEQVVLRAGDSDSDAASGVVAVTGTDSVVGVSLWSQHDADASLDDVLARPISETAPNSFGFIEGLYVLPTYRGGGVGTELFTKAFEGLKNADVADIYTEVWQKKRSPDAVSIVERFGFSEVFARDDYWAHPEAGIAEDDCEVCRIPHQECSCSGAVYRYESGVES